MIHDRWPSLQSFRLSLLSFRDSESLFFVGELLVFRAMRPDVQPVGKYPAPTQCLAHHVVCRVPIIAFEIFVAIAIIAIDNLFAVNHIAHAFFLSQ